MKRRILLIGADTPRCRAYASAIERARLGPIDGVFYAGAAPASELREDEGQVHDGLWFPSIHESVAEIFARNGWAQSWIDSQTINAPQIEVAVRDSKAALAIFAGKGGEIVSPLILSQGVPVLHLHPGALPTQRGSTTIYYSILENKPIHVSALLLVPEIDAGPIIDIREYARPKPGVDVDLLFDCAIRADSLINVLRTFDQTGALPNYAGPHSGTEEMYFVIHPVLKHLALLSLETSGMSSTKHAETRAC